MASEMHGSGSFGLFDGRAICSLSTLLKKSSELGGVRDRKEVPARDRDAEQHRKRDDPSNQMTQRTNAVRVLTCRSVTQHYI